MRTSIKFIVSILYILAYTISGQELPFGVSIVGELQTWGIDDGRPAEGSAKHAVWLGDWNGDGIPEYFVTTKKGGTSTLFYSDGDGWKPSKDWYAPSYSVIALDTRGDAKPEYIIKTSKYKLTDEITQDMFADYVVDAGRSYTTVLKIPENWDPINDPLEPVMTFDRSVPIIQGCIDVDGDGYKDLLVAHHLEDSKYVARYYKGKDDSLGDNPFENTHKWASKGRGSSMSGKLGNHKARWGDLQIINDGNTIKKRLFAVGSEGENNNVIYWDYDPEADSFDRNPTILDISDIERSTNNELHVISVRALPGAIMLAGKDGAYFLKYSADQDSYNLQIVPGIEEKMAKREGKIEYSDFWCFNSGKDDRKMVFAILRKPNGDRDSAIEFRTFDPSLPSNQISDVLMEVSLPPKAQRITALREDDSYNVMLDAKQLIVAHKRGATILDIVY